jgi:hypothetical protein
VEHTVTEEVTGVDIVQTQIKIAGGMSLAQLGLGSQAAVPAPKGFAIQCRVTSEDPEQNFQVGWDEWLHRCGKCRLVLQGQEQNLQVTGCDVWVVCCGGGQLLAAWAALARVCG